MTQKQTVDVIIIGGSYSGLAAAMALGRALRRVLIIDGGEPCNRQTPHSHNFITQDGQTPGAIASLARQQVAEYPTVEFLTGIATRVTQAGIGFEVETGSGKTVQGKKLILATGIKDILPDIQGMSECWGISVLHCPYCHGYEVKQEATGILGNGDIGFEFAMLISNWTNDLTLYTNGKSTLSGPQADKLGRHSIKIVEAEIDRLNHSFGRLEQLVFKDNSVARLKAMYIRSPFIQHSPIPEALGCEMADEGYIKVDGQQKTTVPGVFACGDNSSRMRTVANAVAAGTTAGMMVNKEIILEEF